MVFPYWLAEDIRKSTMKPNLKGLIVLSVLFLSNFIARAQPSDSTVPTPEQRLAALPNDSSRIRPLFLIARSYQFSDSAKAIAYIKQGLALARKYNRDKSICNFQELWAEVYVAQGSFDAAKPLLEAAYKLALQTHNDYMIANYQELTGEICMQQGDYPGAIEHNMSYLHYGEEVKDTQTILVGLVNICEVYQSEKNNAKTVEYANRILQYPYNPRNVIAVTKALEMVATVDLKEQRTGPARDSLQKALRLYAEDKNDNGMAIIYSVLASSYPADPYYKLKYALRAQELWDRVGPNNDYAVSNLVNLGAVYTLLLRARISGAKETITAPLLDSLDAVRNGAIATLLEARKLTPAALTARARAYYNTALDRAAKVSDREGLMQATDSLALLDALDGRYKEAFDLLQEHVRLSDSVFSQENKNRLAGIEADYKVALTDKQLQINKLALSDQIKQKWLLISMLCLVLFILLLIFRQSRLRQKNNAVLEEANRVKNQFFGILNHDLRSPVASLITLLRLRQREPEMIDQQAVEARTNHITNTAEQLLETMEDLLIWSKGQMEQFQPKVKPVAVTQLFSDIEKKFSGQGVTLQFETPPDAMLMTDIDFAKTILRNLTGNALKALQQNAGVAATPATAAPAPGTVPPAAAPANIGTIRWKAWLERDAVWLSITDNGPGATTAQLNALFDENAPIGIRSGLGLHIVRDMARAIGCNIQTVSPAEGGLEVKLQFASFKIDPKTANSLRPA
jgi:signal transduction histidine kinase